MKPTLKIDFWILNADSRAHSWPCRPVPARFQLTTTYWHKSQSFEHALTIDLDRSVPISSTIRVACSLCIVHFSFDHESISNCSTVCYFIQTVMKWIMSKHTILKYYIFGYRSSKECKILTWDLTENLSDLRFGFQL